MKKRTKAISVLAVLAVSSVAVATSGCGDPPVLQSIEITTPPTARICYIDNITGEGQKFNNEGMVVTAVYSDGSSRVVTDYTWTPTSTFDEEADSKTITVTYSEGEISQTATTDISVKYYDTILQYWSGDPENIGLGFNGVLMRFYANGNCGMIYYVKYGNYELELEMGCANWTYSGGVLTLTAFNSGEYTGTIVANAEADGSYTITGSVTMQETPLTGVATFTAEELSALSKK